MSEVFFDTLFSQLASGVLNLGVRIVIAVLTLFIGSKLINDVKHENVYLWVYKNNTSAISLYKKLGFEIIDETETRFKMKKHQ